jgi:hypothetical protein
VGREERAEEIFYTSGQMRTDIFYKLLHNFIYINCLIHFKNSTCVPNVVDDLQQNIALMACYGLGRLQP